MALSNLHPRLSWHASSCGRVVKKGFIKQFTIIISLSVFTFTIFLNLRTQSMASLSILDRLAGPLHYDDPQLIKIVKENFLHPPSALPYNLVNSHIETNLKLKIYNHYKDEFAYQFCQNSIRKIFNGVKSGFFVEAGAIDGEYLSNTLDLELEDEWTGLLVEVDGNMFKELLTKNRRAWSSHCCLAVHPYPYRDVLLTYAHKSDENIFENRAASAHASLFSISKGTTLDNAEPGHKVYQEAQCIPLGTLLLAIGVHHVNLVSLDVEGAEEGILKHFPWNDITVDVWVVEHVRYPSSKAKGNLSFPVEINNESLSKTKSKEDPAGLGELPLNSPVNTNFDFIYLFKNHGYELYSVSKDLFIPNYVFILRNSTIFQKLNKQFQDKG